MNAKTDFVYKHYKPLKDKTLENAVAHRIATQFPQIGGPRIDTLCARMLLEVARETYHSLEAVDRYLAAYDGLRHCRLAGVRFKNKNAAKGLTALRDALCRLSARAAVPALWPAF